MIFIAISSHFSTIFTKKTHKKSGNYITIEFEDITDHNNRNNLKEILVETLKKQGIEAIILSEQAKLNNLYDEFSKKYGLINSRANTSAFSADSSYCLLASLEILDDEGNFVRKADMFTKRTIRQKVVVTSVDTASEALALSLAEKARIDMPYMEQLTGKTEEQLKALG